MDAVYREVAYRQARRELKTRWLVCVVCRRARATTVGHEPPLALHRHLEGSGCCQLRAECEYCNKSAGNAIAKRRRQVGRPSRRW